MRRWWVRLGVLAVVLVVVFVGIRRFAFLAVERRGLIGAPNGPETPAAFGAPFEPLTITSGDRKLDATLVRLAVGPALLALAGRWNWWPGSLARARGVRATMDTGRRVKAAPTPSRPAVASPAASE